MLDGTVSVEKPGDVFNTVSDEINESILYYFRRIKMDHYSNKLAYL